MNKTAVSVASLALWSQFSTGSEALVQSNAANNTNSVPTEAQQILNPRQSLEQSWLALTPSKESNLLLLVAILVLPSN